MRKKRILILSSLMAILIGLTAGSYAWFTSGDMSKQNKFKTGLLGITGDYKWTDTEVTFDNVQPGDNINYTFSISNEGKKGISTLDLKYTNQIKGANSNKEFSILKAAKYSVELNRYDKTIETLEVEEYDKFLEFLGTDRIIKATKNEKEFIEQIDTYIITIHIPNEVDSNYIGEEGTFKIETKATQDITEAEYKESTIDGDTTPN